MFVVVFWGVGGVKLVVDIIKFLMMENLTPHDTGIH